MEATEYQKEKIEYHESVAAEVARQTHWTVTDARKFIGGVEDMTDAMTDELTPAEYAGEILAASAESQ